MMRAAAVALSLVGVVFLVRGQRVCEYEGRDGTKWDLSSMRNGREDYSITDESAQGSTLFNTYYWNFCGELVTQYATRCSGSFVCQKGANGLYYSCGSLDTAAIGPLSAQAPGVERAAWTESDGVTVTSTGGTDGRAVKVHVVCNRTSSGPAHKYALEVPSRSGHYDIYWYSSSGCPTHSPKPDKGHHKTSVWTVLLIVLLVSVVVYLVAGAAYQYRVAGARTPRELVLLGEFWCALPSLVKDGFLYLIHGCRHDQGVRYYSV